VGTRRGASAAEANDMRDFAEGKTEPTRGRKATAGAHAAGAC